MYGYKSPSVTVADFRDNRDAGSVGEPPSANLLVTMYCSVALRHLRKHIVLAALLFSAIATSLCGNAAAQDAAQAAREHMAASQEGATILQPDEMPGIVRLACPSSGTVGTAFKHRSGYL